MAQFHPRSSIPVFSTLHLGSITLVFHKGCTSIAEYLPTTIFIMLLLRSSQNPMSVIIHTCVIFSNHGIVLLTFPHMTCKFFFPNNIIIQCFNNSECKNIVLSNRQYVVFIFIYLRSFSQHHSPLLYRSNCDLYRKYVITLNGYRWGFSNNCFKLNLRVMAIVVSQAE